MLSHLIEAAVEFSSLYLVWLYLYRVRFRLSYIFEVRKPSEKLLFIRVEPTRSHPFIIGNPQNYSSSCSILSFLMSIWLGLDLGL